ncbi:MAG: TolC family protein [Planctomycetota bacterium]|nr:TolC family protein [Planctomycetota bacterium]
MKCRAAACGSLVLAAGLAGCAATHRHDADVELYRRVSDPPGGVPLHEAGADLTLEHALRLASAHNEQLAQQGERYVQALAERQRRAAALKPTFDLVGGTSLRENTGDGIVQTTVGATGQYRLLTGLSDLRSVEASEARARSSRWLILDLRETLLLQTARAYYEVLRAERLGAVLESSVATQMARLEDARARNEVGFTRPLDVAQIEAQVSRTRAQLITARGNALDARATLALLTNADVARSRLTDEFRAPADAPARDTLLALAHEHRQDVLAARAEVDAARREVDAAIGQYAPTLTIDLETFVLQTPDDSASAIASFIQLRVPLFSAGRIEADIRAAWSVFREAVLEHRLRTRAAVADVDSALARLGASRARLEEFRTQVRAARDALTLAEASYQAGLGTNLERVTAQDELLSAELEEVSEGFEHTLLTLELRRACGLLATEQIGSPRPQADDGEAEVPDAPALDRRRVPPAREDGGRT